MVANLWDVTDKDIDRFLACLLSSWLSDDTTKEPRKLAFGCGTQGSRCLPPTTPDRGGSRGVRIPGVPQAVLMDWSDRSPVATVCCVEDWTCLFSRVKPSSVQQPLDRVLLGYYRNIICCWCYKIMQANCVWKWQLLWRLVCKLKNSRNMILFKNFILTLF